MPCAPADHPVQAVLAHGVVGEGAGPSFGGAEQLAFRIVFIPAASMYFSQKRYAIVMAGHIILLVLI